VNGNAPRRIAVVPAYNEEPTVAEVLDALYPLVDEIVVVDDGSTDRTRAEIDAWIARGHPNSRLLVHDVNRGMSEAYTTALTTLTTRLEQGELDADDLVFTVDADGQHDLAVLDDLVAMTHAEALDANLARRDLSYHGGFKRFGNWLVSKWASLWAGAPLHDVESGYRIFRLSALVHALQYYSGYHYSETVEVAVVLSQLGYKVRNDHIVPVPVARSRTRVRDAVIDVAVIPLAAIRVWRGDRVPSAFPTDAIAHLSIAAVLGLVSSLTYHVETDNFVALTLGAAIALVCGGLIRWAVPRPSLALLGPVLAVVAAWLVPQRPDMGSALVLCALFGVAAALAAPAIRRPRLGVLGGAMVVLVIIRLTGTRTALLAVSVLFVFSAALVARFGPAGIPRRHRVRSFALGLTLILATSGLTGYFGAHTVSATWFGGGITHGDRESNEVAITFDDGPNAESTPAIMRILDNADVKATFFIVGKALDAEPDIVRDLYTHGHLVANHSYHHDNWRWLDPNYPELARTQDAFARNLGVCPVWFRPPHGQHTPMMKRVVSRNDMRLAMWDTSAGDWTTNDPVEIAHRVLDGVRGGSIILLHDGLDGKPGVDRMALARAMPLILEGLRERNLRPVRLDDLVGGGDYQSCRAHDN
jgi:peptidoglycan/xylan/chitin deacetylase (PgdA/CDA1 family)